MGVLSHFQRWYLLALLLLGSPATQQCWAQEDGGMPQEFFCVLSFQHSSAFTPGGSMKGQMVIEATPDYVSLIVYRNDHETTFALQDRDRGICFYGIFEAKGTPELHGKTEGLLDVDAVGPFAQAFVDVVQEGDLSVDEKRKKLASLCKSTPHLALKAGILASFEVESTGVELSEEERLAWQLAPAILHGGVRHLKPERTVLSSK